MKIGINVNSTGVLAVPERVLQVARLAEELNFHSLWVPDHVVWPVNRQSLYPYRAGGQFHHSLDAPVLEPITTLAVLAGATRRVRLGAGVLVVPLRNPVLAAKMLVTVDAFSGGRLNVGVGVGWMEEEFQALNTAPFAERGSVTDEYLQIFKALCTEDPVSFQGRHYQLPAVSFFPKPVQRPHPPIYVGGFSPPALRRAGRLGDGWLPGVLQPHQLADKWRQVREHCERAGRDPAGLRLMYRTPLSLDQEIPGPDGERQLGSGTPQQALDDLRRLREVGVQEILLRYMGHDHQQQLDHVQRLAELRDRLDRE